MTATYQRMGVALIATLLVFVTGGVFAGDARAEMVVEKQSIYLGAPYRIVPLKGQKRAACERACEKDKRCRSWSYVRDPAPRTPQCRLFNEIKRSVKNGCCVSGYKKVKDLAIREERGGPQVKRCRVWADDSIKLNEQNVSNGCGYRGRAWHSDDRRHFRRCMRLGPKALRDERRGQRAAIESCVQELGYSKRARCEHYAKVSVLQDQTRRKANCGPSGNSVWMGDYKQAYRWCLTADASEARQQQNGRQQRLAQCFSQSEKVTGPCNDYAEAAIADFRQNVRKGCDLHGNSWHNSYRRHVNWCRMSSPKQRRQEMKKRSLVLKTCKLFGKIGIQWR